MKRDALEKIEPTNLDYINDDLVEGEMKLSLGIDGAEICIHAHSGECFIKAYDLLKNILDDDIMKKTKKEHK